MNYKPSKSFGIITIALFLIFSANIFGQIAQTQKCGDEIDYDAVIAQAAKDIQRSEYNLPAFVRRGGAYFEKGEYEKAVKDFERVLTLNPNSSDAYHYQGSIFAVLGNHKRVIENFSKTLELDPKNEVAFYGRGRAYLAQEKYDLAIEDFNKAIFLDSKYIMAIYARGLSHSAKGDALIAKEDFSKGIEIITENINKSQNSACNWDDYIERAMIYESLCQFYRAKSDYTKSIEIRKDNFKAFHYRGRLSYYYKNWRRYAMADINKSIELNPSFGDNYKIRAMLYEEMNESAKAQSDRQKYAELSEN